MWLIVDNMIDANNNTYADVEMLSTYNNEIFNYSENLYINRSTGEVTDAVEYSGGSE